MSPRNRFFIVVLLLASLVIGLLYYRLVNDLDPRYREAGEETMIDTAMLMARLIEQDSREGVLAVERFAPLFNAVYAQQFDAQIYNVRKTEVDLRLLISDQSGQVLYDSLNQHQGKNFSQWRDIKLALRGEYGARTSLETPNDESSGMMYSSVPIRFAGRVIGAVSVGKPIKSFGQYVDYARERILSAALLAALAMVFFVLLLLGWLMRPWALVREYFLYVKTERRLNLPQLLHRILGALLAAKDELRDVMLGRNYAVDYVQTLTHELKSPLSAIRGAAELLQEPMPPATQQKFLNNISIESDRIAQTVDRMMALALLETQRTLTQVAPVDCHALLREVLVSSEAKALARRITLLQHSTEHETCQTEGDVFLLRRAVQNLVDNAIEFSPPESEILLTAHNVNDTVELHVYDRGSGIPEFAKDKVFTRFYSLARPDTHKKSTGLGLAFVKEIVALHRGKVSLSNRRDGAGAVAKMILPKHQYFAKRSH